MKKYWGFCLIIGIIAAVISTFVFILSPSDGGNFHRGFGKPVTAFEFANTPKDVELVFGGTTDPNRVKRIVEMRRGIYADFAFILAFGTFLFAFFFAAYKRTGKRIWLLTGFTGLLAAAADIIEDVILLGILDQPTSAPLVSFLFIPVYIKFGGLAVTNIAAGIYLATRNQFVWRLFSACAILSGIFVILALVYPRQLVWTLVNAVAIGWIVMLIYSGTQRLAKKV